MIYEISPKESPFLRFWFERKYSTVVEYSGHDERVVKWCRNQQLKRVKSEVHEWVTDELTPS